MSENHPQPRGIRVSFLDLFTEDRHPHVEIPLIQRDYAQGRKSAARVRHAFLSSLRHAFEPGQTLCLDFIYGEVQHQRFQPIDGQQRLTTLYLLHWFLAGAANEMDDFRIRMRDARGESRFRYSVRQTSQRFFSALLDYPLHARHLAAVPTKFKSGQAHGARLAAELVACIGDQPWFYTAWMQDPTVAGALTMIADIAEFFGSGSEVRQFYSRLKAPAAQAAITLDVLDLGSVGLSEEIYIKMNHRGKELTGFEKFKAWLIETHEHLIWPQNATPQDQWTMRLDGDWLDLFWHFHQSHEAPAQPVSEAFFRTFAALAVNFHAAETGSFDQKWLTETGVENPAAWDALFTEPCVRQVFSDLHHLSHRPDQGDWPIVSLRSRLTTAGCAGFSNEPLLQPFFETPGETLTLNSRLWLCAVGLSIQHGFPAGSSAELHWYRVVRNLLENSGNPEQKNFALTVRSLHTLADRAAQAGSILAALNAPLPGTPLNGDQHKEEQNKARLILLPEVGGDWEREIKEIEQHSIFRGQIELLLPTGDSLATFTRRCAMAKTLWDKTGSQIGRSDFLVARALLAWSHPFQLGGQDDIDFSDKAPNWKRQFDRKTGWSGFRAALPALLDSLHGTPDVELALRGSLKVTAVTEPWMRDVIDHGNHLFRAPSSPRVQKYYHHDVFVFKNGTKMSDWGDILIGKRAALRNQLIHRLLHICGWTFLSEAEKDWRPVPADPSSHTARFFRGHHIQVQKTERCGSRVCCDFRYDVLVLRERNQPGSPELSISYPEDCTFKTLRQSIEAIIKSSPSGDLISAAVSAALIILMKACEALSLSNREGQIGV